MAEELTPLDATFLELEQLDPEAHMHIGGVLLFDPLPGGGSPAVEAIRRHLSARLGTLPRFRQRLSEPEVGGTRWPRWEDVPLQIEAHVRREVLDSPGRREQLLEWAGDYYSQRLDRGRPLWEMVLVEGIEGGRWALVTKTHHCMVDGVGSVDIGYLMLDAEPTPGSGNGTAEVAAMAASERPEATEVAREPRGATEAAPGRPPELPLAGRITRAGLDLASASLRVARAALGAISSPESARDALRRSRALADVLVRDELIAAPRTSLNEPIGTERRLAVIAFDLDELKAIKNRLGGTINDVVLAGAAGGFRDLLLGRGEEPPERGLRAMVPVNVRVASERLGLGNRITSLFVHLPVSEPNARLRYERQMDEAEALKSGTQALGAQTIIDLTSLAPPILHSFLARSLYATRLFNITITNVPGPQATLFALGSRMREIWPLVPIAADHSVGIAVMSYDGRVFFCVNADRDSVPDLGVLADGIRGAIEELLPGGAPAPPADRVGDSGR